MPKFAANISMMFAEHPFLDRFAAAADAGFKAVEFQFPYTHEAEEIADAARAAGVSVVLFNLPPGDWDAGERGLAALPGRENDLDAAFSKAVGYAKVLNCPRLHVMSGVGPTSISETVYLSTLASNLRRLAPRAMEAEITLMIEPINNQDIPGYVLNQIDQAVGVIETVSHPAIRLQFDFYHRQIMRGSLIQGFENAFQHVGHVQIANVPGRHEPDRGEIDYKPIMARLDALGYEGWVGCEYIPLDPSNTRAGLSWRDAYQ